VLPGTCEKARVAYANDRVFSLPEFLTERSAEADVMKLPLVASAAGAEILAGLFPEKEIIVLEREESCEFTKYLHNSYCAMSVGFFNLMADFAASRKLIFDDCALAARDVTGFISLSHARVPGPDGKRGFGGKCLPKDLFAFSSLLTQELKRGNFLTRVLSDNFKNRFGSLF
jgi:UDPglucose 6-dehydrogenase